MPQNIWDKFAGSYDESMRRRFAEATSRTINAALTYCGADDRVLDFACGTGIFTLEMARKVKEVTALDTSEKMLQTARAKADSEQIRNIKWMRTSLPDTDFGRDAFDMVTAFNIFLYLKRKEDCLSKIREILKPGGMFLSVTDCLGEKPHWYGGTAKLLSRLGLYPYIEMFTVDSLKRFIEDGGFELVFSENFHTAPPNYFIAARKLG
jgi:ubiquinone/menaquinone biosynthesis C-methylase UbiE